MYTKSILFNTLLSLSYSFAQQQSGSGGGTTVPSSLSSGFDPSAIQLQVSYTGDAFNGFADGSSIQQSSTSKQPVFALGDASGVSTVAQFTIMMVDSTDSNNMALHFLQTGFKADGDKTGISSQTQPTVKYQAPGAFGETGTRQYSFLLYQVNGGGSSENLQGLPQGGSKFDVTQFQSSNGLKSAEAGVAMKVELGGGSGNSNGNGNGQQSQSQSQTQSQTQGQTQGQSATSAPPQQSNTNDGGNGASSTTFAPVTFQSPTVAPGATSTSAAGSGASPSATDSTGAASAAPSTLSSTVTAGSSASASAAGGSASGSASASASGVGSSGAATLDARYLSGIMVAFLSIVAAYVLS
ncbi:MAG: hypothetical protein Q9227_007125 [Pyrenula ochraceoflavens]